jgi:hypothetical protein
MHVLVFDIETVPDTDLGRRLFDLHDLSDADVAKVMFSHRRQETGSEFLPHEQHRGNLTAEALAHEEARVRGLLRGSAAPHLREFDSAWRAR